MKKIALLIWLFVGAACATSKKFSTEEQVALKQKVQLSEVAPPAGCTNLGKIARFELSEYLVNSEENQELVIRERASNIGGNYVQMDGGHNGTAFRCPSKDPTSSPTK